MSRSEQRKFCIREAAYFLGEARQIDGSPGSPGEDWLIGEWEYDHAFAGSAHSFSRWVMMNSGPMEEKIINGVLYCVAAELRMPNGRIEWATKLPPERRRMERICAAIVRGTRCQPFPVPENASTISDLIAAIAAFLKC